MVGGDPPTHEALPDPMSGREIRHSFASLLFNSEGQWEAIIKKEKLGLESGDMEISLVLASNYL